MSAAKEGVVEEATKGGEYGTLRNGRRSEFTFRF